MMYVQTSTFLPGFFFSFEHEKNVPWWLQQTLFVFVALEPLYLHDGPAIAGTRNPEVGIK